MAGSRRCNLDFRSFRLLFDEGAISVRSDADLIRLYLTGHAELSEAAFGALIERHGPMVWGVCRRMLRDGHAAEDAFQSVFLVLARRARSIRVDDSLGRWLHGVTRRVAVRARDVAAREVPGARESRGCPEDPAEEAVRAELRHLIGVEVARLPRKYREAVALCHLDGLSHDQAAEALGLPVGTVRSRLSRARDLLRTRLVRRGVAPAALAGWLGSRPAAAAVPTGLLELTLKINRGSTSATVPSAVVGLAHHAMRSLLTEKAIGLGALLAALGCLTGGAFVLAHDDGPTKPAAQAGTPTSGKDPTGPPAARMASLEDQVRRIIREYDDAWDHAEKEASAGRTEFEQANIRTRLRPDEAEFARKLVDLAAAHPKDPAARDALIWVLNKHYFTDGGKYGDPFSRAVNLLVDHHADDPEVARVGLHMDNVLSRRRDAFLEGIYANAQGREASGLARLALARYLEKKAGFAAAARKFPGRSVARYQTYDAQGKLVWKTVALSNEEESYRAHLRMLDPGFLRAESERLYEDVVARFADVPYLTTNDRALERRARETPSATIADPRKKQEMIQIEKYLGTREARTLGRVAADRLDDLRNLAVGKVAPDFEGIGADGKPVKLSDYRGKVVVMVYWFSTCGPCLREIPHDRELAGRMKGRPFTLLGIVSDGQAEAARKVIESERMTWPNIVRGGDEIAERYHVASNPCYFVLDADGVIRSKGTVSAEGLNTLVEQLVGEVEATKRSSAKSGGTR